jgi:hypothetical protein
MRHIASAINWLFLRIVYGFMFFLNAKSLYELRDHWFDSRENMAYKIVDALERKNCIDLLPHFDKEHFSCILDALKMLIQHGNLYGSYFSDELHSNLPDHQGGLEEIAMVEEQVASITEACQKHVKKLYQVLKKFGIQNVDLIIKKDDITKRVEIGCLIRLYPRP